MNYTDVPIWALFEIMTLGDFGYLLSCLNFDVRDDISKRLGLDDISVDSNGALATVKYFETYLYEQMELQKTFSCFSNDIETTISEMAYHICGKCELTGIKNIRSHDIISILRECCMKTSEG